MTPASALGGRTKGEGNFVKGKWRPVAAAVSAIGMLTLGLVASAPTAQAATDTITGTVETDSGPCTDGEANLRVWQPDDRYDAGGYWEWDGDSSLSSGAYSLDVGSYLGLTATVQVTCYDGDTAAVYYGGGLALTTVPEAGKSMVLAAGTLDVGTLTVPQNIRLSGTISQIDGSGLPAWDKSGTLLPNDSTQRDRYAKYGIQAWVLFSLPGADISAGHYLTDCWADRIGAFSDCGVPAGTYDVWVYSSGFDWRAAPAFNYPQTVAHVRNYQVTAASGGSLLAFRTAAGPAAVATSAPKIGGTVKVGNTVTAVPGVWNNLGFSATDPGFAYQWLLNGAAVSSAETYTLQPADANKSLVLRVTASRPLFDTATAESAASLVAPADDTRIVATAKASFGKLEKGKKATVTVTVRAAGMGALGKIVVAEGSKALGSKTLVAKNDGKAKVTFKMPNTKGSHTLTVTYLGNAQVKGIVITKVVKLK